MIHKKVQLLPNNKAGEEINWEERIKNPEDWMLSHKLDGARVELVKSGEALSREMKLIKSGHVQQMAKIFKNTYNISDLVEAEFWAPRMTFPELMHFFKSEDVTSAKSKAKYQKLWDKTAGDPSKGWKYPGRNVEWLTTWHAELNFYFFDTVATDDERTKEERYLYLKEKLNINPYLILQHVPVSLQGIYNAYSHAIDNGGEGLVIMKRKSLYKHGRITLKSGDAFKLKEDNIQFHGIITNVTEGTVAREGSVKTVNAFGRSKTSQLKEDRVRSGIASGFEIIMKDGRTLTVSMKNFNRIEKAQVLNNKHKWIGKNAMFTGMKPVKEGGVPRHAHADRNTMFK